MRTILRSRRTAVLCLPLLALGAIAACGCDIITADLKAKESAEWRRTYRLPPGGRVEVSNVNGKIEVAPSPDDSVEIVAIKTARASTAEAAKAALDSIEITEDSTGGAVKIVTKVPRTSGFLHMGNAEVRYTVRVPVAAEVRFTTSNGGIELSGLRGRINATTTNGGIRARDVSGAIEATTTNGGVEVDLERVAADGVKLECTNGGIRLRLPSDARATISASISNGGIDWGGLALETTESSRRRLEGKLNGGGPNIRIQGTNGGIRLASR